MPYKGYRADRGFAEPVKGRRGRHDASLVWEVIVDPTPDKPFLGRLFRTTDITWGEWPKGFVFRHIRTGAERRT